MKRKILLTILTTINCLFLNAYASSSLKNIPEGHVLKVQFTQVRTLKDLPKPIHSKGDLILWNGKGLIWRTTEPFLTMTLITKAGLYQIEDGEKIPLTQMGQEGSIFEMLSQLIQGSFKEVKGFSITNLPSSQGKWRIRLTPLNETLQSFLTGLDVEGNDYITQITIHRAGGDRDEISLQNHRVHNGNESLSVDEKRLFND